MSLSWRVWQPVIPLLTDWHDVFAPSLAGHHGAVTTTAKTSMSVQGLADAVEIQLDQAGIDTAHVAGNSLGGWVALELARRGRARSVIALSPAGGWTSERELRRVLRMARLGRVLASHPLLAPMLTRPRMRRALLRGVVERGHEMTGAEARQFFEDNVRCSGLSELLASIKRDGPLAPLTDTGCPVRIAWSSHDRTIPFHIYGRPLAQAVPDAELLTLLGVGHVPMHDNPQLIADTILDVTRRVDDQTMPAEPSRRTALRHRVRWWLREAWNRSQIPRGDDAA
jgi:pimeloyl-ACP methyl ester carboxylesterase